MEEDCNGNPSLPPNYVTLVQLQERWVKEQQPKQREKEEEERKRKEKEDEERKREDQEHQKKKQYEDGERRKTNSSSRRGPHEIEGRVKSNSSHRRHSFLSNRQSQSEKRVRRIGMIKPQSEDSQVREIELQGNDLVIVYESNKGRPSDKVNDKQKIDDVKNMEKRNWVKRGKPRAEKDLTRGTVSALPALPDSQVGEIVNGEQMIDDLKKKKKKKKKPSWGRKGKSRAEEDQTEGTEPVLLAFQEFETVGEKIAVVLTGINGDNEGTVSSFQRNGKVFAVNARVWEKKVPMDPSAEIGRKFGDLSFNAGKLGGKERKTIGRNRHGGQWNFNSATAGRFNRQILQKPRDSNLVWVRKGDASDVNVAGGSSSVC